MTVNLGASAANSRGNSLPALESRGTSLWGLQTSFSLAEQSSQSSLENSLTFSICYSRLHGRYSFQMYFCLKIHQYSWIMSGDSRVLQPLHCFTAGAGACLGWRHQFCEASVVSGTPLLISWPHCAFPLVLCWLCCSLRERGAGFTSRGHFTKSESFC